LRGVWECYWYELSGHGGRDDATAGVEDVWSERVFDRGISIELEVVFLRTDIKMHNESLFLFFLCPVEEAFQLILLLNVVALEDNYAARLLRIPS
jgi:hypothetical protein